MKLNRVSVLLTLGLLVLWLLPATQASAQSAASDSNLKQWIGVDIFGMIRQSDLMGKISMIILAMFSIASWTIIVYKFLHLRQAATQTDSFVKLCNTGTGQLDEAFKAASEFPDSPLAQILREGYLELEIENWYREGYHLDSAGRVDLAKVGIERVFNRTITNEITHLESKLIFLATTTNVCPFIGLFGTVWGIMVAFQSFGLGGTVSLSTLAPGLSTALLATVGGLFCAIPSSIMYNYLTNRCRVLTARMDAFALELSNIVQKQILKQAA